MKEGHAVRIFVLANVKDMCAERQYLTKYVFPRLQERCAEKHIALEISDPYYGVYEDFDIRASYRQEMSRSQIVLAFVGENYGLVPSDSTTSLLHEMIDYGIFGGAETRQLFCRFYLRDFRSCLRVPTEIWTEYWEDDDTERYQKMQALKEQIRQSNVPIREYPAQWDEENPPSWNPKSKGFFFGFEKLVEQILEDFDSMLEKLFPQQSGAFVDPNSIQIPFLEESIFQKQFRKSLTESFIGRLSVLQELNDFLHKKTDGYLLVSGNNGIGKSSVLAKWTEQLEAEQIKQVNQVKRDNNAINLLSIATIKIAVVKPLLVLYHNIGLTGQSRDVRWILEWLCKEMCQAVGKPFPYAKDFDTLRDLFPQLLDQFSEKRKIVIILDGANEVYPRYQAQQFYWLPTHLPSNVFIILSLTVNTHETTLKKRFRAEQITLSSLTPMERRELLLSYCQQRDIEIPEVCQEELIAKEHSELPLYLKVATEEANAVSHSINPIPIPDAIRQFPETFNSLFEHILDRWEKQFGYELVSSFLGTLVVSQNSLPLQRLRNLLQSHSEQQYTVNTLWAPLAQSLLPYLFEVEQQVQLCHSLIQETVYNRYLILDTERKKAHQRFAEFLEKQGYALAVTISELPYHWAKAKNWQKAFQLLTSLRFWEAKANANMINEFNQDIEFLLQECKENLKFQVETLNPTPVSGEPGENENEQAVFVNRDNLILMQRALQLDLSFLTLFPQQVFQCMWNRCYWYDSPESAKHYTYQTIKGKQLPWANPEPTYPIVEVWRKQKELEKAIWLQSKRPLEPHLDSPLQYTFRSSLGISEVTYSHDGKRLAVGSWDNCIRIWDLLSHSCLALMKGHTQWVETLCFSHNSSELATGSRDKTIRIWDVESGKCLKTFKGHVNWISSVAYSPNSKLLASASSDETVKIWDVGSGQCNKTLKGHKGAVTSVAFHPKGELVASSSQDGTIRIWDIHTGNCLKAMKGHTDAVKEIAYSPDGSLLASASFDCSIKIWNPSTDGSAPGSLGSWFKDAILKTTDCIRTLFGHDQKAMSIAFSHDGKRLVSGSWDRTIRVWQTDTGDCLMVLRGHEDCVSSVEFSPDDKQIASGAQDKTARIWEFDLSKSFLQILGHEQPIYATAIAPSGEVLATVSDDKTIGLWETSTGLRTQEWKGHEDGILDVAFHPNLPFLVTASKDKTLRIWNLSSGQSPKVLSGHQDWVRCLAFSSDGQRIISGSSDKTMRVWLFNPNGSASFERSYSGHTDYIRSVAFSFDGKMLVSGSEDKTCRIFSFDGRLIRSLEDKSSPITKAKFSQDNKKLYVFTETHFKLWDMETFLCEQTIALSDGASIVQHYPSFYSFNQNSTTVWQHKNPQPIAHYHEDLELLRWNEKSQYYSASGRNNRNYTYIFKFNGFGEQKA